MARFVIGLMLGLGTVVVLMLVASKGYIFQFLDAPSSLVMIAGLFLAFASFGPKKVLNTIRVVFSGDEDGKFVEKADILGFMENAFIYMAFIAVIISHILILFNLEKSGIIGPSLSFALLSSLYGIILAKFVCQPLRVKLLRKDSGEVSRFKDHLNWRLLALSGLNLLLFALLHALPY